MTNEEKSELKQLAKAGFSFNQIRNVVDCADSTIKQYISVFQNNGK